MGGRWEVKVNPTRPGEDPARIERNFGGGGGPSTYSKFGFGDLDQNVLAGLDPATKRRLLAESLMTQGSGSNALYGGFQTKSFRDLASAIENPYGLSGTPQEALVNNGKSSGGFQVAQNRPPAPVLRRIAESLRPERRPTRDWPVMIESRRAGPTAAGSGSSGVRGGSGKGRENLSADLQNQLLQQQIEALGRNSKKDAMDMDLQGRNLRNYDEDRRLKLAEQEQIAKQRELDMVLGRRSADAVDEVNRLRGLDQQEETRQRNFDMERQRTDAAALEADRRRQMLLGILGSVR